MPLQIVNMMHQTFVLAGQSFAWNHGKLGACVAGARLLHHTHHKYNKEHTLSPFAGLAFNALDGILQVWAKSPWPFPTKRQTTFLQGPCASAIAL